MTGAMQPLDVYGFATHNTRIRDAYETAGHGASNGHVNTMLMLSKVLEVAETYIFGTSWAAAFEGCGYGASQASVGQRLRRKIQCVDAILTQSNNLPSLADLQNVWFSKRHIPIGWLFYLFTRECSVAPGVDGGVPSGAPPDRSEYVWYGRLRSSNKNKLESPSPPVSAAAACHPLRPLFSPTPPLGQEPIALTSQQRVASHPAAVMAPPAQRLPVGRPLFQRRKAQADPR